MQKGDFENLAGKGKPLVIDDDSHIPNELRMAYKIMKNAGFIPPEVDERKAILKLNDLIATMDEGERRERKVKELNYRILKFNMGRKRPLYLDEHPGYRDKLYDKLLG